MGVAMMKDRFVQLIMRHFVWLIGNRIGTTGQKRNLVYAFDALLEIIK